MQAGACNREVQAGVHNREAPAEVRIRGARAEAHSREARAAVHSREVPAGERSREAPDKGTWAGLDFESAADFGGSPMRWRGAAQAAHDTRRITPNLPPPIRAGRRRAPGRTTSVQFSRRGLDCEGVAAGGNRTKIE